MNLAFFVGFFLLVVALPVGLGYLLARRQVGAEAAGKNLPVMLACVLAGAGFVVLLRFVPRELHDSLMTPVFVVVDLVLIVGLVRYRVRVSEAGDALAVVGRPPVGRVFSGVGVVLTVVGGAVSIYAALFGEGPLGARQWREIVQGVSYLLFGACIGLWWGRGSTAHRSGIAGPGFFLPWEKVEGYAWAEHPPGVLKLRVRRRLPFFREVPLRTDPDRREEVEAVLKRYLPAERCESREGGTS